MSKVSWMSIKFLLGGLVLAVLTSFANRASADQNTITSHQLQKIISTLDVTYAAGAIKSATQAEKAIDESVNAKKILQEWLKQSEIDCYEHFFVNYCINGIKLTQRNTSGILQRIEVEAKAWQRKHHIELLDQRTLEKKLVQ